MLTKGDLHIHSTASDGELSPREIVAAARERGIDTIAIADHNATYGIREAAEAGRHHGVSVIPAIELSTRYGRESIHLLGYFKNSLYQGITFQETIKLVKAHKVKKARSILRYYMPTEPSGEYLSAQEGLYFLRTFGASVVLAHPMRISPEHLNKILTLPFDGIEAKYCNTSPNVTSSFVKIALKRFSFYTAGSDFHTNRRKDVNNSMIGEPCLDSSEIQRFLKRSKALVLS